MFIFIYCFLFLSGYSQNKLINKSFEDSLLDSIVNLFQEQKSDYAIELIEECLAGADNTFERVNIYFYPPLNNYLEDQLVDSAIFGKILYLYKLDYCNWNNDEADIFLKMYIQDQKFRIQKSWYARNEKFHEADSMKSLYLSFDSINQVWASDFLNKNSINDIYCCGPFCIYTLFIIIQHSPYTMQRMYFPVFEALCNLKMLKPSSLALMEDRLLIREGKLQKYGTQFICNSSHKICFPQPHLDIDSINYYRKKTGMRNVIDDWIETWGFVCDTAAAK